MSISLNKAQLRDALATSVLNDPIACEFGSEQAATFRGVAFDSRDIQGGELFIALKGESMHGHEFLDTAISRGAALALVEDRELLEKGEYKDLLVYVPDTLAAFWKLAAWWRDELNIPVLGITGSVGKTTVKEMVASILLQYKNGSFSLKSYNNHTGVPYTICNASPTHNWLVLEMGMNSPGELRELTKIARPDVVGICAIGLAHVQDFASIDEIADAKFEIIEGLQSGGICILPAGEEVFEKALERHPLKSDTQLRYFSEDAHEQSAVWYSDFELLDLDGIGFQLHFGDDKIAIKLGMLAKHNARNAACAALAARSLFPELSNEHIQEGLLKFRAPGMRMNVKRTNSGPVIIDDCYNANPASMRAALSLVSEFEAQGKKTAFIVGDMLELGEQASSLHAEIGELLAEQSPEYIIAVGEYTDHLLGPAKQKGLKTFSAESPKAAAHTASKIPAEVILVKGSRGVKLDQTVSTLVDVFGGELFSAPDRESLQGFKRE